MAERRVLKVYISSPSDVPDERAEAVRQVQKLNDDPDIAVQFRIEILEYEEKAPPIVGRETQAVINDYMGPVSKSDLVICIFGQRFGTEHVYAGRSHPSGTYHEFLAAERAYRNSRGTKPIILLYRMLKDPPPPERTEEVEQARLVEDFFRNFYSRDSHYKGLYEPRRGLEDFRASLARKLKPVILREFSRRKGTPWFQSVAHRLGFMIDPEVIRADMIIKVREIWIHGVLNNITSRVAACFDTPLEMGRASGSSKRPRTAPRRHLSHGEHLRELFDQADHQLLILGEPGAGKSFKLLELTGALLERAAENPYLPIPVVFNLSSWTGRGESLAEWLAAQLIHVYRVPGKIARQWVNQEKLVLCLDGLDEITVGGIRLGSHEEEAALRLRDERRGECLRALNDYVAQTGVWMVLCCREVDSASLKNILHLRRDDAAITRVGPLRGSQVRDYMKATKWELSALRQAMKVDRILRDMARRPFLLTAMALAYRDERANTVSGIIEGGKGGMEARLQDLFQKYVHARSDDTESEVAGKYPLPEIRHYLGELAQQMQGKSNLLLVEQLQPDWLPKSGRWKYVALVSLFLFLFMSLFIGLPSGAAIGYEWAVTRSLSEGLYYGFICALATAFFSGGIIAGGFALSKTWGFGVAAGLTLGAARGLITWISPDEGGWSAGLRVGLISSLMGVVVLAPLMGLRRHARDEIRPLESQKWSWRMALLGGVAAAGVGGVFWAAFGTARGLGFGLGLMPVLTLAFGNLGTGFEVKTYPNQGIRQSAATAGRIALFSGITGMICFGASYWFSLGRKEGIINVILGTTLAACSLGFGAMPWLQHLGLRRVLASHRIAPLKIVHFLEAASDLHLLRRVGGGYMFQHDYLRKYFLTLHQELRGCSKS
jgi:MFS family permease